jgi:DNA mismatch repair protein MutS
MTTAEQGKSTRKAPIDRRYGDLVRQYLVLREQHPGVILLFRVGSFYEILFDDAELVAGVLGLKLGERPSGGSAGPVPQCGFTHHALDSFLPRLLSHGYRVAVCEEEESGGDALRERSVVRTLTPGTVTDPRLLREDRPTYLVAIVAQDNGMTGLAWTDLSVGEFKAGEFDREGTAAELQRLDPAEILIPKDGHVPEVFVARRTVTQVGSTRAAATHLWEAYPGVSLADLPNAEAAAGLIVEYLTETQTATEPSLLGPPLVAGPDDVLRLDAATQRHLELVETERAPGRDGSLLETVDRTATSMGRRMLREWLLRPLTELPKIRLRQRIVAELVANDALRDVLRARLRAVADLERLAGRAAGKRSSVEDLRMLAQVADVVPELAATVASCRSTFLRMLAKPRPLLAAFAEKAAATLAPPEASQPIRMDASPELALALADIEEAMAWQSRYIIELQRLAGLTKVKLERTSTQGMFLEVPVNTVVPASWIRRGGLQKVERYTTPELEEYAVRLAEAETMVSAEVARILASVREVAAAAMMEARDLAKHLAAADALLSLATIAAERGWVQPTVDDSNVVRIEGGRHPVIEGMVASFQPNDSYLEAHGAHHQVVVLTGPNMAGKSTWMRQTALIVLLAQVGSFVPARQATIGVVDAIFTRIGAVDDLAAGRSTFMVEMLETATVLQGATDRSLVILDEIGRGTSTHDGMAIAWAVVEYLARGPIRPRTIAATHYHELAALQQVYSQVCLQQASVEEGPDGINFPHRIEPGAANRSFGIEVARLAHLPDAVLDRARQVADAIEPLSAEIARHLGTVVGS